MGRGVVGGPAVVGALRVLRVPLEVDEPSNDFIVFPLSFCRNNCDWRTQGLEPSWLPWFWVAAVGSCQWPAICSGACSMACCCALCHPWSQGLDCPAKVVDDGSQLGASWSAGVADSSVAGEGACY